MFLVAGLGNPGDKYQNNRHNIGFMAVNAIADYHDFSAWRKKFNAEICEGFIEAGGYRHKILLLKPQTFMNESGRAIGAAMQFYKIPKDRLIVFHDELDLVAGKIRVKFGGGIAGHNGLRSIRAQIGADFYRVRLGIGHPGHKTRVHDYVLSDFGKSEQIWVRDLCDAIARSIDLFVSGETEKFQTKIAHLAPVPANNNGDDNGV